MKLLIITLKTHILILLAIAFPLFVGAQDSLSVKSIDDHIKEKSIRPGWALHEKDLELFGSSVSVRAFDDQFFIALHRADRSIELQHIKIQIPSKRIDPGGAIGKYFRKKGHRAKLGSPLQGEHIIFNDKFRIHVFTKAVVFWRKSGGIEVAMFEKPFKSR